MGERISLARGAPSTDLLPVAALASAARAAVLEDPEHSLGYGGPAGHHALRAWFARHLDVPFERVLLTNGSLQALGFVARELLASGRWIAVEAPTYDFSLKVLASTGAPLMGVRLCDDGLDIEQLETLIERHGAPAFCYVIPTFQNPTGVTTSIAKRRRLVAMARGHGFPIIEDDPYRLLRFAGDPAPTLLSLEPEHVVHLTSLTKVVAPGLRCGAAVLGEDLHRRVSEVANQTYIAPGHFAQATAARFLNTQDLRETLEQVLQILRERRDALISGLAGLGLGCTSPAGGYFTWVDTAGYSAAEIVAEAAALKLDVVAGGQFFVDGGGDDRLRVTWAAASVKEIEEGISRLALVLRTLALRGDAARIDDHSKGAAA